MMPSAKQRWITVALSAGLVLSSLSVMAKTPPSEPLKIRLNTTLDAEKSHYGDPFEGVLAEPYTANGATLPAGTVLRGKVHSARHSRPFALPGYVALDVQEVAFPSGEVYHFQNGEVMPQSRKINHPKAKTIKNVFGNNLPLTAVSVGVSVPLRYAAGMAASVVFPIAMGARMAVGALLEGVRQDKTSPAYNAPAHTRIGYGILRGTGLPAAYYFLKPSPEPNLKAGAIVPVQFSEPARHSLLEAADQEKSAPGVVSPTGDATTTPPPASTPPGSTEPGGETPEKP